MVYQPTLERFTPDLGRIDYLLTHNPSEEQELVKYSDDSHVHAFFEIYVNVTGDVSFLHGSSIYDILPYDIVFSRPGEFHHCIYRSGKPHEHYCLWFKESGDGLSKIWNSSRSGHIRLCESDKKQLSSLLCRLEEKSESKIDETICLLSIISLICAGGYKKQNEDLTKESRVGKILEYIDSHLAEIRRSSEVADAFYMSVPNLNRILREETSLSLKKILEGKRMTEAQRLLGGEMSVTEVCYAVGFSDLSRFISKFKKRFGITPNKYKAVSKKEK